MSVRASRCERRVLEKLVLGLRRGLSQEAVEQDFWVVSLMDWLVGRRRSGLDDPRVRAGLNLPQFGGADGGALDAEAAPGS
jgi:hypothetical protein